MSMLPVADDGGHDAGRRGSHLISCVIMAVAIIIKVSVASINNRVGIAVIKFIPVDIIVAISISAFLSPPPSSSEFIFLSSGKDLKSKPNSKLLEQQRLQWDPQDKAGESSLSLG